MKWQLAGVRRELLTVRTSAPQAARHRQHGKLDAGIVLLSMFLFLAFFLLAVTPASAQDPTPTPTVYVVERGDTLAIIAQRFDTTVEAIVNANDIPDPSLISVGQKLIIPTAAQAITSPPAGAITPPPARASYARVHTVRPGETLPSLAFRYGTTFWALRGQNSLDRLGLIWPGQKLTIPPSVVATSSTPAFPRISGRPPKPAQGSTMVFEVKGRGNLELEGKALGQDLAFVKENGGYWALLGVDAMTKPGAYPLVLTATEVGTGDQLTMRETFTVTSGNFAKYNIAVPADRQNLLDPALVRAEQKKVAAVFGRLTPQQLWLGKFGLPLKGEVYTSAPFGQRRSYAGGPVSSYHTGQDYGADSGTPVYAPITGTVVLAEPLQVRGKAVILDHGLGVFTGFWYLSKISVQTGQVVGPGQVVGRVGNTGLSTGPHLHWEMRVGGVPVNPVQWTRRRFP